MGSYRVGLSRLQLLGHDKPSQPGELVEHDFSVTGPEGEHGPSRELALLESGALLAPSDAPAPAVEAPEKKLPGQEI